MIKINTVQKTFNETCTVSSNLVQNFMTRPVVRQIMEYAEPRMLSTLIVSGATSPWDTVSNNAKTAIGTIPKDKTIGSNGYRYQKHGRIQIASEIIAQVGTSLASGFFQLRMKDNYLVPGMNVLFYDDTFQARVMGLPSGTAGNYVYTFQSVTGEAFSYATMVTPQLGVKTCFGMFTSYGERSLRGYGRSHYPEQYINHLTIQRKTISISGDANTDVLEVHFNGTRGWWYLAEQQARLQFMMENEWQKWFGRSTYRDAAGNLLTTPRLTDTETGEYIIQGDGLLPQIEGGNEAWGSGANGMATVDDFMDMIKTLSSKSDAIYGKKWYVVTGMEGYYHAQVVLRDWWANNYGGNDARNLSSNAVGGQDVTVGANFNQINFAGNSLCFVQHPLFDNDQAWRARGSDGTLAQSGMYIFLDTTKMNGKNNIEILSKGSYGVNRSMIMRYLNGMTGDSKSNVVSSVDALEYNMLKHDGIFAYSTETCGILRRNLF